MNISRVVCGLLLVLVMTGSALAQSPVAKFIFEDAEAAFAKQDYKTTLAKLEEAEREFGKINPPILYLRIMARHGMFKANPMDFDTVVRLRADCTQYLKDYGEMESVRDQAREVYRVSAEVKQSPASQAEYEAQQKEADAMYNRGLMYANGQGVTKDYTAAREWYEKGAEKGHASAMFQLGWMYEKGQGVTYNYATACGWYEKAAEKGSTIAMYFLGRMYHDGTGVKKDYTIARDWFEKAANGGDVDAMTELAKIYEEGEWFGLKRDPKLAQEWRNKAAAAGKK